MALTIAETAHGDVTLLKLSGHVAMGLEATQLKDRLRKLVADNKNKVVMNIGEVTYLDSFGLGELVACLTRVKKSGGSLALVEPTQFVREVLHTTRLETVFAICESDDEAVTALSQSDRADSGDAGAQG